MKSVLSNKVEIRNSGIDKKGMYAKEKISKGEIVYIKGGHILTRKELFSSSIISSYLPISDNYFIGAISSEEEPLIKLYNNHSCDPNCGMHGEITFIAIRDMIVSRFFRKFNFCRLAAGSQPAMLSDSGSISILWRWAMFM